MTESIKDELTLGNSHFLSKTNPTANVDQRDLEALGIKVLETPAVQKAKQQAAGRWKSVVGPGITEEALLRFDELIDEWTFNYVLKAVNSDPNYPKVLNHLYGPAHEWFGMKVPGSRGSAGDGADQNYILIPVDGYARFELHGRRVDPDIADVPFTLIGNNSLTMSMGMLDWKDVQRDSDDTFTITMDPESANGRRNHLQTNIDVKYLFIRDCRSDWRQSANAYRIHRLDPPTAPPFTLDQLADRSARYIGDDIPAIYSFKRTMDMIPINVVTPPFNTGTIGGLETQSMVFMHPKLEDDDAFVITVGPANAAFRSLTAYDVWFRTFDYWKHTSCMNNSQSTPNQDGSTTYVISIKDPGVYNWIDPAGFNEFYLLHRWQGLPKNPGSEGEPWIKGELVKLNDIEALLPEGMKRVTTEERKQQLAERLETFITRYIDN